MTVVVCTNRGAEGLSSTLAALDDQTIRDRLQIVVVDDGAPEDLGYIAERHGAELVHHDRNRGLAAARNSGWCRAQSDVVAFTDDDCRPGAEWASELLRCFEDPAVVGAGGSLVDTNPSGLLGGYHEHRNPLAPLEMSLAGSSSPVARLLVYLRSNLVAPVATGPRRVFSVPGANMAIRRSVLEALGGFDDGIRFGGEDEDMFFRIRTAHPDGVIWYRPQAQIEHDFAGTLSDTLRRARAYGRGNARNAAKHPTWPPTIFPGPFLCLAVMAMAVRRPQRLLSLLLLPLALFPRWVVQAVCNADARPLSYAYLQMLQEASSNVGFLPAWVHYRHRFGRSGRGRP